MTDSDKSITPAEPEVNSDEDFSYLDSMDFSRKEMMVHYQAHLKGWPDRVGETPGSSRGAWHASYPDAFNGLYKSDAHTVAYYTPKTRRLKYEALGRAACKMILQIFDVDSTEAHASGKPATDEWWFSEKQKLLKLRKDMKAGYFYRTRGGYRVVFELEVPLELKSEDDARKVWTPLYLSRVFFLRRVYGIICDTACREFNREYRLPQATRAGNPKPDSYEIIGTPANIGYWDDSRVNAEDRAKAALHAASNRGVNRRC